MIGMVIAWAFASFLYFKVVFDYVFYHNISIIAALLMAIVFGILVFVASGIYAAKLLKFNWSHGKIPATLSLLIGRTLWPFIGLYIAYGVVTRLIVFGFSKELTTEIRMLGYRGSIREEGLFFALIVFAPILIHYAMCIYSTYRNANRGNPYGTDNGGKTTSE